MSGWLAAGASLVSGLGSLFGGNSQSNEVSAAEKAALAQEKANWQQTSFLNAPYVAVGNNALTAVADLSGANGRQAQTDSASLFQTDPGYQFDLAQGTKAADSSAAARGLGTSGAEVKGVTNYAEGLADNSYSEFYNRLTNLATMGQTAIGQDSSAGSSASSGAGQTIASAGQDQANITGNTTSGIANALTSFLNNQTVQNALTSYSSPTQTTPQVGGLY